MLPLQVTVLSEGYWESPAQNLQKCHNPGGHCYWEGVPPEEYA